MPSRIHDINEENRGQYAIMRSLRLNTCQKLLHFRSDLFCDPDHRVSIPGNSTNRAPGILVARSRAAATSATGSRVLFITKVGTLIVGRTPRISIWAPISSRATSDEGLAPARKYRKSHSSVAVSVSFGMPAPHPVR